jgi:death-on-curing protein
MIEYLDLEPVLDLHEEIIVETGGSAGLRDASLLQSALANPSRTFGERDLYPTMADKAGILLFSIVQNHPFIDGNKRIGHAVSELFLRLNNLTIVATTDELEEVILSVASGELSREVLVEWISDRIQPWQAR